MLSKEIAKVFKDPSIQFDELISDYEIFEEPLLINTISDAKKIMKVIKREDLNTFFFNLSLGHLNNTYLYARNILKEEDFLKFFICITSNDDENEMDSIPHEFGFYMYRFFVSRKNHLYKFDEKIKKYPIVNLNQYPIIKNTLVQLNLVDIINVHVERWIDQYGYEIKRFFFIFK